MSDTPPSGPITPKTIRACADTVMPGECITFPNGLVVDKRRIARSLHAMADEVTMESLFCDLADVIGRAIYWYQGGAEEALKDLIGPEHRSKLVELLSMIEQTTHG